MTNDTLGSPSVITDSSGNILSRRDFMPFGEEISAIGGRTSALGYQTDATRQKFTGYERDSETDLDFAQARMYSNKLGRFTTTDPILRTGRPDIAQSWNRYIYTQNNPLVFVDPTGLYEWAASLGGDEKDETKLSQKVRERRSIIRKSIDLARANLDKIKEKYGEKSTKFDKAKKAVDAIGTEYDTNNVRIGVTKNQRLAGFTNSKDKNGIVLVTFKESFVDQSFLEDSRGDRNGLFEGTVAHEGSHVYETNHGIKLGTRSSEHDGLWVQGLFAEVSGYDWSELTLNNPTEPVRVWDSSWQNVDQEREKAINRYLDAPVSRGGYSPNPSNKPKKKKNE